MKKIADWIVDRKAIVFIIVAILGVLAVFGISHTNINHDMSKYLQADAALMGVIGGLMNICSLFCRPFVGNLADRVSKYKLSFIGSVLMALSCIGYIVSFHPVFVMLARIVNGVGFSCCSVSMSTWMSDLLPKDKIGSGMGIYGTMNALGMAVAPAVGVALYEKAGYRPSFLLAAGFAVLTSVMIQFVHDKGEAVLPSAAGGDSRTHKKPELVAVVLLLLRLSLRSLFDRKPFCFFMVLGSTSAFLGISLLAGMNGNITMFFAAAFMAGGYGMMCSVCQSTAILLAGKDKRGLANSTYYIGLDLGMSFGPMIGGLLFGSMDIRAFYPVLTATVPAGLIVYRLNRHKLAKK